MDIKTLIANDNRMSDYPTVVIFRDLTVEIFNAKFKETFPSVAPGDNIEDHFTILNKDELFGGEFSSPAVISANGEWYLCAFCRIGNGSETKYSFMIAAPGCGSNDGSFQYLVSKLSVLCKCRESADLSRKRDPSNAVSCYERLRKKIDACLVISETVYGKRDPCPLKITEFLEDAFSYYSRVIFGDGKKHFGVVPSDETAVMDNVLCISLMVIFRFALRFSVNGFVKIRTEALQNGETVDFIFKPGKKLLSLLPDDDMLYSVLGFDATDLVYIKKLVREQGGQVDMVADPASDGLKVSLFMPEKHAAFVKSPPFIPEYVLISHILADALG